MVRSDSGSSPKSRAHSYPPWARCGGTGESVSGVIDMSPPPAGWRPPADQLARCQRAANSSGYANLSIKEGIGSISAVGKRSHSLGSRNLPTTKNPDSRLSLIDLCRDRLTFPSIGSPSSRPALGWPEAKNLAMTFNPRVLRRKPSNERQGAVRSYQRDNRNP